MRATIHANPIFGDQPKVGLDAILWDHTMQSHKNSDYWSVTFSFGADEVCVYLSVDGMAQLCEQFDNVTDQFYRVPRTEVDLDALLAEEEALS
jgi:hypothetical protein